MHDERLAGLLLPAPRAHGDALQACAARMLAAAPDEDTPVPVWCDAQAGVALAGAAHESSDGRYLLVLDGCLFNRPRLRAALLALGHLVRDADDADLLLAAVVEWGVQDALRHCDGAFSLALWDVRDRCLWLACDRMGAGAIFYGWAGDSVVFGARLASLWRYPGFDNAIDRDVLAHWLQTGEVPAPHCLHQSAFKLQAGHCLRLDPAAVAAGAAVHAPTLAQQPVWDPLGTMVRACAQPFPGEVEAAALRTQALLQGALEMRAGGAAAGVLLDGGAGALVLAAQARGLGEGLQALAWQFDRPAPGDGCAQAQAALLGVPCVTLRLSAEQAASVVDAVPAYADEPLATPAALTAALLARELGDTAACWLEAAGGAPLLANDPADDAAVHAWQRWQRMPALLRRGIAAWSPAGNALAEGSDRAMAAATDQLDAFLRLRTLAWRHPSALLPESRPLRMRRLPAALAGRADAVPGLLALEAARGPFRQMRRRAAAAAGADLVAPWLDAGLLAFAWSLPATLRSGDAGPSPLLAQLLQQLLPDGAQVELAAPTAPPVAAWLRGGLHGWADDLLAHGRLQREAVFDAEVAAAAWRAFNRGERRLHRLLWPLLAFQGWHARWRAVRADAAGEAP